MSNTNFTNTIPKDRPVLLKIRGQWIEARWIFDEKFPEDNYWDKTHLHSHGCGCCAGKDPEPDAWAELPTIYAEPNSYEEQKQRNMRDTKEECPNCLGNNTQTWGEKYLTVDPKIIHSCKNCGYEFTVFESMLIS